ncbi:F-box only protein 6 [Hibiscus syriacus]|uniref:F-box only protein 6 n=1 Tax=Hibiscus syriacus TaxID=106335 RepID=A0A6A3AN79_HIBSY|nr:F-box only protein 6 [Hibiscus syriacus]
MDGDMVDGGIGTSNNAVNMWFVPLINDTSAENYYSLVMAAGKSGSCKLLESFESPPSKRSRKDLNGEKLHFSADTPEMEVMEQDIWKEFPEDLFEAVIARLPISTFFRFRSVCRKWNSLMDSKTFSQHCVEIPLRDPWFYAFTHDNVNIGTMYYDPSMRKWHRLAFKPAKMIAEPVASAGGLVVFLDIGHRKFSVCNPLTQSIKELPPRSVKVWSCMAVGMTLNRNSTTGGYSVMWVGGDGECEVYDSVKNSWTRLGTMPLNIKVSPSHNFQSRAVFVDDTLYFMRSDPEGIVSYNMETGVCKQFIIPAPVHLSDHSLAEYKGRIMLIGLLTKNAATCVCIWELQKMTLLWKEVDRMPNIWCLEFYGKHVRMTCSGNKGLLMLHLRSRQMNRLVTYNVKSGEWLTVPACVAPRGRKQPRVACCIAFNPCLTATA